MTAGGAPGTGDRYKPDPEDYIEARPSPAMNAPDTNRAILRHHVAAIEARHPIKIIGLLPRGSAVHVKEKNALDFLAKKKLGLSLLGVAQAEVDLTEALGRPVGIVLTSEVRGEEAARLSAAAKPL